MNESIEIDSDNNIKINKKVIFKTENNFKIKIHNNVVIEDFAEIIADKADCEIKDSFIGKGCRIRNSIVESVMASPGSQILETKIKTEKKNRQTGYNYLIVLKPGLNYEDNNFAFTRGAVIKRIKELKLSMTIEIPVGHCLIGKDEYLILKEKSKKEIKVYKEIERNYFIINSQYSHIEPYEQYYNPEYFDKYEYLEGKNIHETKTSADEVIIDLKEIRKEEARNKEDVQRKINEIFSKSIIYRKIIFILDKNMVLVVESGTRELKVRKKKT